MKEIEEMISSLGFPIVVSILLMYQNMKITQSMEQIVANLKELVENNNKLLNSILDRIGTK